MEPMDKGLLLALASLVAAPMSSNAQTSAAPTDAQLTQLRSQVEQDATDLDTDRAVVKKDRANVRAARDAYDEAADKYGMNSPEARQARAALDQAQLTLHQDLGDLKTDRSKTAAQRKSLSSDKAIKALATKYGVTPDEIASLRKQGISWSDIGHALVISKLSGQQLSPVLAAYKSNKSWDAVAKQYGLNPADVDKEALDVAKTGRQAEARVSGRSAPSERERGAHGGHGQDDMRRR
jgi:hypothetical protein